MCVTTIMTISLYKPFTHNAYSKHSQVARRVAALHSELERIRTKYAYHHGLRHVQAPVDTAAAARALRALRAEKEKELQRSCGNFPGNFQGTFAGTISRTGSTHSGVGSTRYCVLFAGGCAVTRRVYLVVSALQYQVSTGAFTFLCSRTEGRCLSLLMKPCVLILHTTHYTLRTALCFTTQLQTSNSTCWSEKC
jgi:hypothetical protein